ncbi:hypothetical protein [Ruegeria sp. 6PALISEP08]|uniref:hypothetical protein n=1 Tax=Ruegeria sp. 6PALISEP08 TaxID=1225660 RepID=UPI00067EC9FB|nr:hypothetical protein [Ruegeria sp. 6PALISEP08]
MSGVPEGVILRDASTVLELTEASERILQQHSARFSDLFRLKVMQAENLIWVDCDVYLLKPVTFDTNLITIGRAFRDGTRYLWNGVMYLDPDSDLFSDYLFLTQGDKIQFRDTWDTNVETGVENKSAKDMFERLGEVDFYSDNLPRNFFGPILLTLLAREHGNIELTPPHVHYPFGAPKLRKNIHDPQQFPLEYPDQSETIHFFGSMVRRAGELYRNSSTGAYDQLPAESLLQRALSGTLTATD